MRRYTTAVLALVLLGCASAEHDEHDEHGDHHDEGLADVVRLTPTALQRAEITFSEAQALPLDDGVDVPAEVQADPDRVVHVASLVAGQIAEVRVSVGDRVEAGQVLAVLRSVDLGETRAALAEARAELDVAEASRARQEALSDAGLGAGRRLVEARGAERAARARVRGLSEQTRVYGRGGGASLMLRSLIAGEVVERHATVGEAVPTDRTLFVVADTREVWVVGRAYMQDIAALHEGAEASLTLRSQPEAVRRGTLEWVSPMLDESTRSLPVRMRLSNEDGALRPGLFGTLHVARPDATPVPTIEAGAVQTIEGRDVVFVPGHETGEMHVRAVTVGRRAGGRVAIVDGLEPGERYVSTNAFVLKSQLMRGSLEGHSH